MIVAKYVANREKDRRFVKDAIRAGLVDHQTVVRRLASTTLPDERLRAHLDALIAADFALTP